MRDCNCGKPVRLGATRVRVDRKQGVFHYIAHMDGSKCDHLTEKDWQCLALKPYPKNEDEKEYAKLIVRWEDAAIQARQQGTKG